MKKMRCKEGGNTWKLWKRKSERLVKMKSFVWLGEAGTDQKTGGKAGGGSDKNIENLFGSDKDGQDYEQAHRRDSTGETF